WIVYSILLAYSSTSLFFFSMTRPPPTSTLFPTRRSSDLLRRHAAPLPRVPSEIPGAQRDVNRRGVDPGRGLRAAADLPAVVLEVDRKSTRLNSSHLVISYAVFCLKKKKTSYLYHATLIQR